MTVDAAVLGTTLGVRSEPGANLARGETENWPYLLPTLEPEHVLCLHPPNLGRLWTLAGLATRVTVHGHPWHLRRLQSRWRAAGGPDNVVFDLASDRRIDPDVDLLLAFGRRARLLPESAAERCDERVRPDAALYGEWRRLLLSRDDLVPTRAAEDEGCVWLRPPIGSVHAAAPLADAASIRFLHDGGFDRRPGVQALHRKVLRRVLDHDAVRGRLRRQAVLLGGASARQLPRYVRAAAARSGLDLDGHRWAMSAPGRYRSKKVIFFVFDGDGASLGHVVKMTRNPEFNHRLENEWRALTQLASLHLEGVPRPAFLDHHAGLALLGQDAVVGTSLRPTLNAAGASEAASAAAWLEELGAATVQRVPATVAGNALTELVDRFERLYRLPPRHRARVRDHVRAIGEHRATFPLVFQHGDPGAWNATATGAGRVGFLDWEAADPLGMPLWDLLYFMRSYGVGAARTAGTRDALDGVTRVYLDGSELSRQLVAAARSSCARIGLDPALIEPLFHLCWVHRAVKEATRLPADRLDTGHYVRLLQRGLSAGDAPGLRALFAAGDARVAPRAR